MKHILFFIAIFLSLSNLSFSQNRQVARGATPGELYLTGFWYGIYYGSPPYYDTLRTAVYRLTENGKKLTIQYDADYFSDYFTEPGSIMQPDVILTDATAGVVYAKRIYEKNWYDYTQLWVSFDYGKNWTFREENTGNIGYIIANTQGLIYKGGEGVFESNNYANSWIFLHNENNAFFRAAHNEACFETCEFISIGINDFYHTYDCFQNYINITIDEDYVFGQMWVFPDVYRGGLPGEVYVSSQFPGVYYKVSFSADTGHTFRHVYVSEKFGAMDAWPCFMSDREPGVFYIIRSYEIGDKDPWGWHTKICVEYYRDYGETLVDTYCHDITKDYNNEIEVKEIKKLEEVRVYPNPTTGELRITNYELRIEGVEVFDVYGRNVGAYPCGHPDNNEITINISDLQTGIYFVRITTDKGTITKKIIKL